MDNTKSEGTLDSPGGTEPLCRDLEQIGRVGSHQPHKVQQEQVLDSGPRMGHPWICVLTGGKEAAEQPS